VDLLVVVADGDEKVRIKPVLPSRLATKD